MSMKTVCLGLLLVSSCFSQTAPQRVFYYPKPKQATPYRAPMKPLTRFADLKAKHRGKKNWQELVIDDGNSRALMIAAAPGSKYERRLYADSPGWWAVLEGRIRFEIEQPDGGFKRSRRAGARMCLCPNGCCTRWR